MLFTRSLPPHSTFACCGLLTTSIWACSWSTLVNCRRMENEACNSSTTSEILSLLFCLYSLCECLTSHFILLLHIFPYLVPKPVVDTNITVSDTNTTSLSVFWTYPSESEYTGANINCTTSYHDKSNCDDKTASKNESSVNYDGLIPGVEYEFIVTVVSDGQLSPPSTGKKKTLGNIYLLVYEC